MARRMALLLLPIMVACALAQEQAVAPEMATDADVKVAFDVFDYNEDGVLSQRELRGAVHELGFPLAKREAEALFQTADANADGKLSLEEFRQLFRDFGLLNMGPGTASFDPRAGAGGGAR